MITPSCTCYSTRAHTHTHTHTSIRADSGFRHVKPTEYEPRLFHFHGIKKKINVKQVPLSRKSLDSTDVFILDLGLTIYQVNIVTEFIPINGTVSLL